jgi:hypothetical protein
LGEKGSRHAHFTTTELDLAGEDRLLGPLSYQPRALVSPDLDSRLALPSKSPGSLIARRADRSGLAREWSLHN